MGKLLSKLALMLVVSMSLTWSAYSNPAPIRLVAGTVPFVLHREHPGPHNIIFDTVMQDVAPTILMRTELPYARALRDFQAHEFDCIYATTNNSFDFTSSLIEEERLLFSRPVNIIKLHIFTREGEQPLNSFSDLIGKTLVGTRNQLRAVQQQTNPEHVKFITVIDAPKAFELLDKKRADAAVVYDMDAYLSRPDAIAPVESFPSGYTARYRYDPNFAPTELEEVMACWNTPQTSAYIAAFNKAITQMETSGKLREIFNAPGTRK